MVWKYTEAIERTSAPDLARLQVLHFLQMKQLKGKKCLLKGIMLLYLPTYHGPGFTKFDWNVDEGSDNGLAMKTGKICHKPIVQKV